MSTDPTLNGAGSADDSSEEGDEAPKRTDGQTDDAGRLDSLEARIDDIQAYQDQYIKEHVVPKLGRVDDMEAQIDELKAMVEKQDELLESVVGLAHGETSSPEKRAVDTAMILIRRAKNRVDEDKYLMWYREIQDSLADHGHGPPVYNQWVFDAMDAVAEAPGFGLTTTVNPDGREVKALKVDLAELPDSGREAVSNEIITGMRDPAPQSTEVSASE
jgi:hypothetical protein